MRFVFDDYELDVTTRQLTRAGEALPLTPKAFQLLEILLRRRPAVVTKDQIFAALWPDTYVGEANIPNLVAEIRSAVGDSARKPRYIRTAFRTGYAFLAGASEQEGARPGARGAAAESGPSAGRQSRLMCSLVGDGHRVPLGDGRHVIGRSAECDVQLTSSAVSRRHAVIEVHGPQAVLEDLRSRNGTFVRGRRITRPRELRNGDRLCIGDVELVFRLFSPMSTTHRIQLPQKLKKAVDRS